MPPICGDAENAIRRLRLQIIKTSDDESIFAWKGSPEFAILSLTRGMLAQSFQELKDAGDIERREFREAQHFVMTNKALPTGMP